MAIRRLGDRAARAWVALAVLLALSACDQPRSRAIPPDPMDRVVPIAPMLAVQSDGMSLNLPRRPESPVAGMGQAGAARQPIENQPAVTPAGQWVEVAGFAFDPVTRRPAMGVDLELDGIVYPTSYGKPRPRVAKMFKDPLLAGTGYNVRLPPLRPGAHQMVIRVVASDGGGYYASAPIALTAR